PSPSSGERDSACSSTSSPSKAWAGCPCYIPSGTLHVWKVEPAFHFRPHPPMSDPLHHECGIAFVRLKKDLGYYLQRYDTCLWGFQRLYLLMEKQHNRGQDGVGIGCVKLDMPLGQPYLFRE